MKIFKEKNTSVVNSILTRAFIENKSVNYILRRKHEKKSVSYLIEYSLNKARLFGEIWVNDAHTACCILLDPQKVKSTIYSLWLDIGLVINAVGVKNISKASKKENLTKKYLPKSLDFIHLWFIGVDVDLQGNGYGSNFMKEIINYYMGKKEAICLETSTEINLPFYKRLGFEVYHIENFGFDFYFLIKYLK